MALCQEEATHLLFDTSRGQSATPLCKLEVTRLPFNTSQGWSATSLCQLDVTPRHVHLTNY